MRQDTVCEHGAMTASVYSTDEKVLDAAERAASDADVARQLRPSCKDRARSRLWSFLAVADVAAG
jgi:hypothetical protein